MGGFGERWEEAARRFGGPALLAIAAAAWAPALWGGFLWDDRLLVLDNRMIDELSLLPRVFAGELWSGTAAEGNPAPFYRPLMIAGLAIDRAIWGTAPFGYHLHSLCWHLLATAGVLALLRRLVGPWPALAGAAVFALHALQAEAVAWVSARVDPMAAALSVWALVALLPAEARPARIAAGAALFLAATLSKEHALLAPALLAGLDLARWGRLRGGRRYAALAGMVALTLVLRVLAGTDTLAALRPERLAATAERLPALVGLAGRLLFVPWPLSAGRHLDYLGGSWLADLASAALLAGGAVLALRRGGRLAAAGIGFALLAVIPAAVAISGSQQVGERYLYLPLVGLALAVAAARPPAALALVLPAWVWIIGDRLPDWRSGLALTRADAEATPNPYAWTGYGQELRAAGEPAAAAPWLRAALAGEPPHLRACEPAVGAALEGRLLDDALAVAVLARERGCPSTPGMLALYAEAHARRGRWEEAAVVVDRLLARGDPAIATRAAAVAGAVARWRGDASTWARLVPREGGERERFVAEVEGILGDGGE